jgi:hypothetical protein
MKALYFCFLTIKQYDVNFAAGSLQKMNDNYIEYKFQKSKDSENMS